MARHRATALRLLRTVVRSQRWGVAPARPRGRQTLRGVFARLLRGLDAQDVLAPT